MKRIVSLMLAAVLVLAPCMQSFATDPDSGKTAAEQTAGLDDPAGGEDTTPGGGDGGNPPAGEPVGSEGAEGENGGEPTGNSPDTNPPEALDDIGVLSANELDSKNVKGQIDVGIIQALDFKSDITFTITLTDSKGDSVSKNITLGSLSSDKLQGEVTFNGDGSGLEDGKYNLSISAPGYRTRNREITVEGLAYKLMYTTGFLGAYFEENEAGVLQAKDLNCHPGVLRIGDVDGNGEIDDQDKKALVDTIDSVDRGEENNGTSASMDLNRDGKVDLADLNFFVQGYFQEGKVPDASATIQTNVPASAIGQKEGSNTVVESGLLDSLLTGEGSVALRPASGEISSTNPVSVEFEFAKDIKTDGIVIDSNEANPVENGTVEITYVDAEEPDVEKKTTVSILPEGTHALFEDERVSVTRDSFGNIAINLGSQVAVKRVTLTITGTKNNNLAEISKVEFVNGMDKRIPAPEMNIPENLTAVRGNKSFVVSWNPCVNVTGYEVRVKGTVEVDKQEEVVEDVISVRGNSLTVSALKEGNAKLVNGNEYEVSVQSVNGAWKSGYCDAITVIPKVDKAPDAPDYVNATGKYKAIDVSWKKMKDTDYFNIYYREAGTQEYTKIEGIEDSKYTITDLKDKADYELYVTGVNEVGESKPSKTSVASTMDQNPAQMPKYKQINRAEKGQVSEHIISAAYGNGEMQDSPLDKEKGTAWGTVDNIPTSHYVVNSWDGGGFNPLGNRGLIYEFDEPYTMDRLAFQEVSVQSQNYGYARVRYWDEAGEAHEIDRGAVRVLRKADEEGRIYYMLRFPGPITAKKIQFALSRVYVYGTISISEVSFYEYDSIEEDIMALYTNDLHTELKPEVTMDTINELDKRINTTDPVSKEYHPDKANLERELQTAKDILSDGNLGRTVEVHNTINTKDVGRGFGGLNAWQPLGVTAAAGEEITVYVGHNTKRTGDSTNLQLVSTQYHSEAASMFKVVATLKVGRNEITIPKLWSLNKETGGALYIQYTNNNANDKYAVRVSGGVQVPILDLYTKMDAASAEERLTRAKAYIEELEAYIAEIETKHNEVHKNSTNKLVQYDYVANDCILGASDIMLDTMMISLPAQQILAGVGTGSTEEKARKLVTSMEAMENMMYLFYQHKGLNNNAADAKDKFPANHLNIRYQTMFAGAFMYASGNHIGIEWGSAPDIIGGGKTVTHDNGKYVDGRYFGWGIAHEIGHCINQGTYAVAEITNNYFAVLAQAKDTNDSVRFQYPNVYDKVTSGTKGRASNVFTQLGMYWQLHLAYDNGFNYKTYENYDEQLANLFFARVDAYSRNPGKAPTPGDVLLSLCGDKDQDLMRLSCAAAQKNILEFFERWGMTPNADTINYANCFPKETRAIYYVNDDSRVQRIANPNSPFSAEGVQALSDGTTATVDPDAANKVNLKFSLVSGVNQADVLGYEVVRCITSNGDEEKEVVGFATGNEFTDTITTLNNRVVTYEVTAIDQHLNRSAVKRMAPLKISHKGNIDKTYWSVSTNDMEATSKFTGGDKVEEEYVPCGPEAEAPIKSAVDNQADTTYTGLAGVNAEVVMELNQTVTVSGLQYTVNSGTAIKDYSVSVRNAEGEWIEAASGTFGKDKVNTVYFGVEGSSNIALYQTSAVKLSIKNQKDVEIAISELDVLGVTGDDVEFRKAEGTAAIGKLEAAYKYGDKAEDVIPAGSIVFTGKYKGNSAYNVVILYDQDGNIVGGADADGKLKSYQVLFSDVPETGNIQDVYDGTWIYWIAPGDVNTGLKSVRAELYRVDNALTNEGQRLVSDCIFEEFPAELPNITLSGKKN